MKRTVLIILFLWNYAFAQPYVASWTGTANSFEVQRSKDKKNWSRVYSTTKNGFTTSSAATYYWRIKLNTDSGALYSNIVWVYAMTTITSAKLSKGIITWRGYTETNLSYYTIDMDTGFEVVPKKSSQSYSVKVPSSKKYSIVAHYKNEDKYVLKTINP